jgi:ubiquinone/menaquinone biosynthesis C-methylase UbiE
MDMRHLDVPAGTFDGVWCSFSLLQVREEEIGATLSGFKSVLKPGGLFSALQRAGHEPRGSNPSFPACFSERGEEFTKTFNPR